MDDRRKNAYRRLLYWAMLDIRGIQWITFRPLRLLNPFTLRTQLRHAVRAGAIADWLHNLAQFASNDFDGFREARFWREYEDLLKQYPGVRSYRDVFEQRLGEPVFSESESD